MFLLKVQLKREENFFELQVPKRDNLWHERRTTRPRQPNPLKHGHRYGFGIVTRINWNVKVTRPSLQLLLSLLKKRRKGHKSSFGHLLSAYARIALSLSPATGANDAMVSFFFRLVSFFSKQIFVAHEHKTLQHKNVENWAFVKTSNKINKVDKNRPFSSFITLTLRSVGIYFFPSLAR